MTERESGIDQEGSTARTEAPTATEIPQCRPGIGMPTAIYLDEFGAHVEAAFGCGFGVYHVGSSLRGKQWRDVDVRIILSDYEYEAMGFGDPTRTHSNPKWVALVLAFSALGQKMTGLPIDFQIQQQTLCNKEYDEPRSALGIHLSQRHSATRPTIPLCPHCGSEVYGPPDPETGYEGGCDHCGNEWVPAA